MPRNKNTADEQSSTKDDPRFICIARGTRHSIGIDAEGVAHSWGKSNSLGQLGRSTKDASAKTPGPITGLPQRIRKAYVSQGNDSASGHSALIDDSGMLWMSGCDRWQQLGLGSSEAGSTGYTWKGGKLWHDKFVLSNHVADLMKKNTTNITTTTTTSEERIRDMALGGDHTLILGNDGTVYAFGKGGDGQLGLVGKPFVSAPVKSTKLSSPLVAAVCAIQACSATMDSRGSILRKEGKCISTMVTTGIEECIERSKDDGLVGHQHD